MPEQIDPSIPLPGRSAAPAVPNYQGQWIGQWVRGECLDEGSLAGFCQNAAAGGALALTLEQAGSKVSGTLQLRAARFTVSGCVDRDGALVLSGECHTGTGGTTGVANLAMWRTTLRDGEMSGSFSFTLHVSPAFGLADVNATLWNVTRGPAVNQTIKIGRSH
jgi:hypothetical protein